MPGRNDPCPCGSGKKYKKCCYALDAVAKREPPADSATAFTDAADKLAAIIAEANDCLSRAITTHRINNAVPTRGYAQIVVSFFGAMGHGAARAVVALCREGLEQQALVNFRCLVEYWTKAYYYGEHALEAETFIASLDTARARLATLRGHRLRRALRAKVEAAALAARARRQNLTTWEPPGVEEMMTKLSAAMPPKDRQLAYFTNYRFASTYAHGDITVLPNVLVSNDAGDRIVRLDNTKTGFPNHTLRNAARIVMSLAHRVGHVHGIDLSSVLKPLDVRIASLGEASWSESGHTLNVRREASAGDAPPLSGAV